MTVVLHYSLNYHQINIGGIRANSWNVSGLLLQVDLLTTCLRNTLPGTVHTMFLDRSRYHVICDLHYSLTIPSNLCTVNDRTISIKLHNFNELFTVNMCSTTVKHATSRRHITISLLNDVMICMTLRHFYKSAMRSRYDVSSPSLIKL